MKNPFIQMAVRAVAMAAAFRENAARSMPGYKAAAKHRSRIPGKRNPAGSKLARRFAKHQGVEWKGEVVHTGAITKLNRNRMLSRLGFQPPL